MKKADKKLMNIKGKRTKISPDTNIADLVFKYPQVVETLMAFGLHCVGCFASQFDTIGQGAQIHGMSKEEIDEMLKEVEKVINNPEYAS